MKRTTQIVVLCEDEQHSVFMSRFLKRMGWQNRQLRIEKASRGKGSAEQFVRDRFPRELEAYRRNRNRVSCMLAVMIDGDNQGVVARRNGLYAACQRTAVDPPKEDDRVAIFVPTWNIETWLTYLNGEEVEEDCAEYPRLERARDCQDQVNKLKDMCDQRELMEPAPLSLRDACQQFQARLS